MFADDVDPQRRRLRVERIAGSTNLSGAPD